MALISPLTSFFFFCFFLFRLAPRSFPKQDNEPQELSLASKCTKTLLPAMQKGSSRYLNPVLVSPRFAVNRHESRSQSALTRQHGVLEYDSGENQVNLNMAHSDRQKSASLRSTAFLSVKVDTGGMLKGSPKEARNTLST
ncbi:hypothetical protein BC940DRAFT_321970 [Gongronella butleri]|nr:hypothetical protein BC940DRAFT_321970 [Gongronella butleri]